MTNRQLIKNEFKGATVKMIVIKRVCLCVYVRKKEIVSEREGVYL